MIGVDHVVIIDGFEDTEMGDWKAEDMFSWPEKEGNHWSGRIWDDEDTYIFSSEQLVYCTYWQWY
jgi:hypothetical protein